MLYQGVSPSLHACNWECSASLIERCSQTVMKKSNLSDWVVSSYHQFWENSNQENHTVLFLVSVYKLFYFLFCFTEELWIEMRKIKIWMQGCAKQLCHTALPELHLSFQAFYLLWYAKVHLWRLQVCEGVGASLKNCSNGQKWEIETKSEEMHETGLSFTNIWANRNHTIIKVSEYLSIA